MQVVEPCLEQAAEVVERRRKQAAEESSGLIIHSRASGNDNRDDNRMRHPAKPAIPSFARPSFLDSSLRWNDDGGRNGLVAIPKPLCHACRTVEPQQVILV